MDCSSEECDRCQPYDGLHSVLCNAQFMKDLYKSIGKQKVIEENRPAPAPLPQIIVDKFAPYESLYELTLTIDKDDPYELRQWIDKIAKSAMFNCKAYIACIELTKAGLPHIHALLFGNAKYMDASKIKKLKFPYRYELKRVRIPGRYYEYINKEQNNQQVIDYCIAKGIEQFWELFI